MNRQFFGILCKKSGAWQADVFRKNIFMIDPEDDVLINRIKMDKDSFLVLSYSDDEKQVIQKYGLVEFEDYSDRTAIGMA